jgi:HAD superfamily hydrolase (TIGR01549 family)
MGKMPTMKQPLSPPARAVVFDLDGTLVDSLPTTFEAFNQGILACGGRAHTPQEIMKYFGPSESVIFGKILGEDRAAEAYAHARAYLDQNMGSVTMFEGVLELLRELRQKQVPMAIVTGRGWDSTQMILEHHGLEQFFETVIANDHVPEPKPAPHGIQLALSRLKLAASEIIYVGDSTVDIIAARAAGSYGVAALWDSRAQREKLIQVDPHYLAEHPSELIQLVG